MILRILQRRIMGEETEVRKDDIAPFGKFELDPIRFHFEVAMEEFRQHKEEMLLWTSQQNSIVNYVILFWIGIFSFSQIANLDSFIVYLQEHPWGFLVLAIFLSPFGITFTNYEIRNYSIDRYREEYLKPLLYKISNSRMSEADPLYEEFNQRDKLLHYQSYYFEAVSTPFTIIYVALIYLFVFSPTIISIVLYVFTKALNQPAFSIWEILGVIIFFAIAFSWFYQSVFHSILFKRLFEKLR